MSHSEHVEGLKNNTTCCVDHRCSQVCENEMSCPKSSASETLTIQ